jgi:hypothetical protein
MLHTLTVESNDFLSALLGDAIEHERIPPDAATREANTINRYLKGAIQATQNYLDKDLYPTIHTYTGVLYPFDWTRGNIRNIGVKDDSDVLLPTQPAMSGGMDLRAGRLQIGDVDYLESGKLVIAGGFGLAADIPDDVVQFILAVFGTHYSLREASNYSSMVFNVDNYPKYLLDPYRTLSYA